MINHVFFHGEEMENVIVKITIRVVIGMEEIVVLKHVKKIA